MDKKQYTLNQSDLEIIDSLNRKQLKQLYNTSQYFANKILPLLENMWITSYHKKLYLFEKSPLLKECAQELDKIYSQISVVNTLHLIFTLVTDMIAQKVDKEKSTNVRPISYNKKLESQIQSLAKEAKQVLLEVCGYIKSKKAQSAIAQDLAVSNISEKELIKSSVIELGNYEIGCFYNMLTDFNNHIIPELIKMPESSYSHNVFLIEDKTLNYEDILEADSYEYFKSLNIFQELKKIFQLANYWYQECHDKDSAIDTEKEISSMAKSLGPQILEFCKNLREVAGNHGNDEYFSNIN